MKRFRSRMTVVAVSLATLGACSSTVRESEDRYAALDALIAREPKHVGALHHAARTAANAGDADRAIRYLRALADTGFDDALEPADFAVLAERRDYRAIADRLEAASPPVGDATLFAEADCLDVLPEGTAYDMKRGRLLMSSGRRRNVMAVDDQGRCSELVPPGEDGLFAVLGMDVDPVTDTLWVAGAAAPFMRDPPAAAGATRLSRIDLDSGRVVASYDPPTAGLLNDLDLLPDGRIVVTDSVAGTVYLLDPRESSPSLNAILPAGSFEGPNGIVALADGGLLVADFHGLWHVDVHASPATKTQLATPEHRYLGGIDGLARDGDQVIAIQNLVGRGRVWRFRVDATSARVVDLALLLRAHPDLRNPTTGVVANDRFLFVADPNLQTFVAGAVSAAPEGRRGHRILTLPLP